MTNKLPCSFVIPSILYPPRNFFVTQTKAPAQNIRGRLLEEKYMMADLSTDRYQSRSLSVDRSISVGAGLTFLRRNIFTKTAL